MCSELPKGVQRATSFGFNQPCGKVVETGFTHMHYNYSNAMQVYKVEWGFFSSLNSLQRIEMGGKIMDWPK